VLSLPEHVHPHYWVARLHNLAPLDHRVKHFPPPQDPAAPYSVNAPFLAAHRFPARFPADFPESETGGAGTGGAGTRRGRAGGSGAGEGVDCRSGRGVRWRVQKEGHDTGSQRYGITGYVKEGHKTGSWKRVVKESLNTRS
jgi:hypothetical protein